MYAAQGAYYEKQVDWVKTFETRRAFQKQPADIQAHRQVQQSWRVDFGWVTKQQVANMYAAQGAYYEKQVDWVKTFEARRAFPKQPADIQAQRQF
jgi:hypothetical protein